MPFLELTQEAPESAAVICAHPQHNPPMGSANADTRRWMCPQCKEVQVVQPLSNNG